MSGKDLEQHITWTNNLNERLNAGSRYFTEFGFNANGNLIYTSDEVKNITRYSCDTPVFPTWKEATTEEYVKPLGSGYNQWAANPRFTYTGKCAFFDPLNKFFANTTNRDAVGLVSHTFTHLDHNDATYHDANLEIVFNLKYAELLNFTNAARFSGSGLISPAISGLHNGDVLRAWANNGLWHAMGDNTRPKLRNLVSSTPECYNSY